jgi:hypothetical protein
MYARLAGLQMKILRSLMLRAAGAVVTIDMAPVD